MKTGIFVGQTTIDIQFFVDVFPVKNKVKHSLDRKIDIGGPSTNAAIAFSHLGGDSTLISPIGNHSFSDYTLSKLTDYNVKHIDTNPSNSKILTISTILTTNNDGDRTIITKNYSTIKCEKISDIVNSITGNIILIDLNNYEVSLEIAKQGRKKNIPIVMDADGWRDGIETLFHFVDVLIVSENFITPTFSHLINFSKKYNLGKVAITRGNESILCYNEGVIEEIAVPKAEVVDTLGAGDIFHGSFCYYYCENLNFINSIKKAAIVASNACKHLGIREWMNHY